MGSTSELRSLIAYYINGLLARRWTILVIAWAVCGLGWFMVALIPNSYTSTARIYVDTETLLRPLMADLAVQPDVKHQIDIMRRTLLTRPNVEKIARKTDMDLSVSTPIELEQLIERLSRRITISAEGANIFTLEYSNSAPKLAQRVVDTTLQIFVELNLGDAQRDMESARRFIDQQISEYETKLRNAELKVADYKRANSAQLGNTQQAQQALEFAERELKNLQAQLQSATWQRDQVQVHLASTPKALGEKVTAVGGAERAKLEENLNLQRQELDRLKIKFTDRHPDVVALQNVINQLEQQVKSAPQATLKKEETPNPAWEQLSAELSRIELSISGLKSRIDQQLETVDTLTRRVANTPEALAELVHLNRDYQVLLKQYEKLIERRESARMAQRMESESENIEFRIIEPPVLPIQPSGPPRVLLMGGLLMVGMGLGVGVAFLRILLSDAFINAKQLTDAIGLPVIGTLSISRSVLGGPGRVLEAATATCAVLFLLAGFGGLSYFYLMNPEPSEFRGYVEIVAKQVLARFGQSI